MKNVIFYSPHFGENTLRFVGPIMNLPEVTLIGLGQDPWDYIEELHRYRGLFHGFYRVENAQDQAQLEARIEEIRRERPVHAILNVQEPLQMLIGRIRDKFDIPGLRLEQVKRFRDKDLMKREFRRHNILTADSRKIENEADEREFIEKHSFPIIIKPLKGAGAENTFILRNYEDFEASLHILQPSPANPVQIEEFIEGQEGSFDTVTIDNKVVFYSITTYHPCPLDAMLNPWIQPIYMFSKNIDGPEFEDVRQLGRHVVEAFKPGTGINHMEWFRRQKDGRVYAAEIAARPPGEPIPTLHNYGHDIDLFSSWGKLMIEKQFDYGMDRKHHVGCACLRAQGEGNIRGVAGLDIVRKELGSLILEELIPTVGTPKTKAYIGEGSIYCRGQNYSQVFDALKFVVETVKIYC